MPTTKPRDLATMSFEEALDELQALVRALEKGESKLDEAIQQTQDEMAFSEEPRTPSSERVANVRHLLDELAAAELAAEAQGALP